MTWLPVHRAVADAMADNARLGQAVAKGSSQNFQLPQTSPDGQTLTLFPGTGKDVSIGVNQLFPESGNNQSSDFTSLYGNDNATVAAGFNARSVLNAEASRTGQAYQTLAHSANRSHPDLSNDPIWKKTDYVMDNYQLFAREFVDCASITSYHDSQFDAKLHDYKTCVRGPKPPSSCTYVHNWEVAPMVEPVSSPTKVEKCGEGCIDVWVGQIADNYWQASCAFFEASSVYNVVSPDAITDAKLEAVYWDDYIQVFVDGNNVFDTHPNVFQCDAHPPNLRFAFFPFTDVTGLLKSKGRHTLKVKVLVGNGGEGYARIRIHYNPKATITKDEWSLLNPDCQGFLKALDDGMCSSVNRVCAVDPGSWDSNRKQKCVGYNGVQQICESDLQAPPFSGVPNTCTRVEVSATCDFDGANAPCWTDISGVQHCPNQVTGQAETCKALEQKGCGFIRSDCVQGANGSATGTCWLYKDVYDCGSIVPIPTMQSSSTRQCVGPIRCMGEECVSIDKTQSRDFVRATAALNTIQQMGMDKDCAVSNDVSTCTVFKGQGGTCKTVGALVTSIDCCNAPKSIGIGEYIDLLTRVSQIDNAVMRLDATNVVRGSWEVLRTPVVSAWDAVTNTVGSAADSITGGYSSVATDFLKDSVINQFGNMAMEQVATWVGNTFGGTAGNLIFSSGGSAAFSQSGALNPGVTGSTLQVGGGGAMIGSLLNAVMIAYAVYQILVMIVQLIWQCEQKEYELAAKKSLKSCTYLGSYCNTKILGACVEERESYCCYSSPLARILQEQIRPQLGMSYGDIKQPDCQGIPINRLSEVDWDRVNLDEWLAILKTTNRLPTAGSAADMLNLEKLTGQGSHFNIDGGRVNTLDRNVQRLAPLDVKGIRRQSEAEGWAAGSK